MTHYRHYSFDLWLTLIRSNPLFKKERARFFYDNFNTCRKTIDEVDAAFRQVDLMCNAINEKTGKNIDAEEMYLMVISTINNYSVSLADIDLVALLAEMDALVFKYEPVIYCDNTPKVLQHIKEKGNSINLLSNTGFIKGPTLRKVLDNIGIGTHFNFQLYSDEAGYSKPGKEFFGLMLSGIADIQQDISLHEIIHIGDNPKADVEGARAAGIHSMLINSNEKSILSLIH